MEQLTICRERPTHHIKPETHIKEDFDNIVLADKASEIADLYADNDEKLVKDVLEWSADVMGKGRLVSYLESYSGDRSELYEALVNSPPDSEAEAAWLHYYNLPSLNSRFTHLANVMNQCKKVEQVFGDNVKFHAIPVAYRSILNNQMPCFSRDDAHPDRITNFNNPVARLAGGAIAVGPDLLEAVRGKYTMHPAGIDYKYTQYGDAAGYSNLLGDYGLLIIADSLYSRQDLKEISRASGVDCMNAGFAEGIAIASTGLLRIGDTIGLPKGISNAYGDYYSGINVKMQYTNNSYDIKPLIYFGLWRQEGSQNCIMAIK